VQVGDEWTLEHGEDGLHKIIGELDESFDNSTIPVTQKCAC
jgi:hypothetical protein